MLAIRSCRAAKATAAISPSPRMAAKAGASESAASHHLRLLRAHRVVQVRRSGRMAYYRLADSHVRMLLDIALTHIGHAPAAAHPERDFLGIEVHRPGVGRLLLALRAGELTNVRIVDQPLELAQAYPSRLPDLFFGEELVILILFSIIPFLVPLPMMFLGLITASLQALADSMEYALMKK